MKDGPGRRIGGYRVVRELARGGMGVVYEVEREETGGRFAMKTMLPSLGQQDPELLARFVREARLAARLDHPHVVRTHAADLEGAVPWLVQDLLPGGSLADVLRERGRLPVDEAVAIARKVALGLNHAHERGVLHRDVKPTNVLLDDDGEPRLVDFGLARRVDGASRLSVTGQILGSPAFMAPEQALGDPVDARTDVYGAGALLYTLLAGEPPFRDTGTLGVLEAVISRAPPPLSAERPDVPRALEAVVARAMAKKPAERFASAAALAEALAESAAPPASRAASLARQLALGAVLAVALAGAALVAARARATSDDPTGAPGPTTIEAPPTTRDVDAAPPAAPPEGWRATLEEPGTYRLTWEDRYTRPGGDVVNNRFELTLALAAPELQGERATIAASVSALRFSFASMSEYDSTDPSEQKRGFEGLEGGGALIRETLGASLSLVVDLRTGDVIQVLGAPALVRIDGDKLGIRERGTGVVTEVRWPVTLLARHVNEGALRAYLVNVLHVFPDAGDGDGQFDGRVWCTPNVWFELRRRAAWSPDEGRLELATAGIPQLVRNGAPPRGLRATAVRVVGEVTAVDGRITRSRVDLSYEDPTAGESLDEVDERIVARHGTFTLERLEPEGGDPPR